MTVILGVKYQNKGSLSLVQTDKTYVKDTWLVVDTEKGADLAKVVVEAEQLTHSFPTTEQVLRLATSEDFKQAEVNVRKVEAELPLVKQLVSDHQLGMKIIDMSYPLDCSQVLITFTAEKRVDFRQLLRELAALLKTRIELRQLTNREESKVYGGLGPCGRPLCCSTFLGEFPPVSIKMAKNQHLSLNSGKMNGHCGRLMCCLSFEDDFYQEARDKFPDYGEKIKTDIGVGEVVGMDILSETVQLKFEDRQGSLTYSLEDIIVNG